MSDSSEKPQGGLEIRTALVTDQNDALYVHLQFALGILSTAIAVPVDSVPDVANAIRKALLSGHKDALETQRAQQSVTLDVVTNKLLVPGRDR